jgi:vacuolar protein sorting-associated protein 13D
MLYLQALRQCGGHLDDAALWLTRNAEPSHRNLQEGEEEPEAIEVLEASSRLESGAATSDLADRQPYFANSAVSFSTVQLKTSCVNLVIIDDCKDADCPLVELSLSSLNLRQRQGCIC